MFGSEWRRWFPSLSLASRQRWLNCLADTGRGRLTPRRFGRPKLEGLEERLAPAIIDVLSSADSGPNTLRQALIDANASVGVPDAITFSIGTGLQTIALGSALPEVTDPVTIDGTTQEGFAGTPLIELNGSAVLGDGLVFGSGSANSEARGLVINRFGGSGIVVKASGIVIAGNYLGTDAAGAADLGNFGAGVLISSAPDNTVGGMAAGDRNVISGNGTGVLIDGVDASGNQILGNYVGTNAAGSADLGNSNQGVSISSAPGNTVGGAAVGARNVISGNGAQGVLISFTTATGNRILGNYVGIDATGSAALGNSDIGVYVVGASDNTVGGAASGEGNVISGNAIAGIGIVSASGNRILGNYVGTNAAGSAALGNAGDGVFIQIATANAVGGAGVGEGNLISGNTGNGINLFDVGASGNQILGNYIGTNAAGSAAVGNIRDGVSISDGSDNTVGGSAPGARNVISANTGGGVTISGTRATGNRILGNYVGTDAAGSAALGNTWGVLIETAPNNTVGGTTAGARNVISGNGFGIFIDGGDTASGNQILGNYVGTDATGSAPLGNLDSGVRIEGAPNNTVGGTAAGARNVISGNKGNGIRIGGNGSAGNQILGNYVGTNAAGSAPLGNVLVGVFIFDASNNVVGAGNVISANLIGIQIAIGTGNQILGNYVGTDATGSGDLGNSDRGVFVGGSGNTVGGTAAGAANVIAFNLTGVGVEGGTGNALRLNSIFDNDGLGIDLGGDGVTANDPLDGDNNLQNSPVVVGAFAIGLNALVSLTLNSTPNATFDVDLFGSPSPDPSGFGEGKTYLGTVTVTTDGVGDAAWTSPVGAPLLIDSVLSATATDTATHDTSEFSNAVSVRLLPSVRLSPAITDLTEEGGQVTLTATLSAASSIPVTVRLAFGGTATNVTDYTRSAASIVIPAGQTTGTLLLRGVGDSIDEPDETIVVDVDSVENAAEEGTQQSIVTILDDDLPSLSIRDVTVAEGDAGSVTATFTATLSAPSGQTVTVNFATANGTGTSPADYAMTGGVLTFAPGVTTQMVNVTLNPDTVGEPDETFFVNLTSPTNATVSDSQGQGTILDDEPRVSIAANDATAREAPADPGQFTVTRVGDVTAPLRVFFSISGTASNGGDYQLLTGGVPVASSGGSVLIAANASSAVLDVNAIDDMVSEANETVIVTLSLADPYVVATPSAATVTIVNDPPVANDQSFAVPENSPNGTAVGQVGANDPNGDPLAYSITGGNTGGAFAIAANGQLIVANLGALDFETNPVFALTVQVSDGTQSSDTATVTVNLGHVLVVVPPEPLPITIPLSLDAVGSGAGMPGEVKVFDAVSGAVRLDFLPYGSYDGGVDVAMADVNGDGTPDVITGAGAGAPGGHVKVFDGVNGAEIRSFLAFPGFSGGVRVAAGDVNGDGKADIIVGAGAGAPGGHVKVFDSVSGAEIRSFLAFPGFSGGVNVAAGNIDGAGFADVVVGAGAGALGGHVKVFDGVSGVEIRSFLAFTGSSAGVFVAAGDVNGDGFADVIAGRDAVLPPLVKVFSGASGAELHIFDPYSSGFTGGVRVGSADLDGDGLADVLTGAGPGAGPHAKGFSGVTLAELDSIFAFSPVFPGGVYVGGK